MPKRASRHTRHTHMQSVHVVFRRVTEITLAGLAGVGKCARGPRTVSWLSSYIMIVNCTFDVSFVDESSFKFKLTCHVPEFSLDKKVYKNFYSTVFLLVFLLQGGNLPGAEVLRSLTSLNYRRCLGLSQFLRYPTQLVDVTIFFLPHSFWFFLLVGWIWWSWTGTSRIFLFEDS